MAPAHKTEMKHQNQNAKIVRSFVSVSFQRADTIITCDDTVGHRQRRPLILSAHIMLLCILMLLRRLPRQRPAYIAAQFISVMRRRERERERETSLAILQAELTTQEKSGPSDGQITNQFYQNVKFLKMSSLHNNYRISQKSKPFCICQ